MYFYGQIVLRIKFESWNNFYVNYFVSIIANFKWARFCSPCATDKVIALKMNLKQYITIVVLIAIGLAITLRVRPNGWSSLIWYIEQMVFLVLRAPYMEQYRANVIVEKWENIRDKVVLHSVVVATFLLPIVHLVFGLLSFANYSLPIWAVFIGVVTGTFGIWLVWCSHADLGSNWSYNVEVRDEHALVTNGVYKVLRHPMYSGFFVMNVSQALLIQNWIVGPLGLISFFVMYAVRVDAEEQLMRDHFGDEYNTYCESTDRIIPMKAIYGAI